MRRLVLTGANPFVTLYDDHAAPTAYASIWRVDWSPHGPGAVIVLWHGGRLRVITDAPVLGAWVERRFVRHFDEATALGTWPDPVVEVAPTTVTVDPASGSTASGADVAITTAEPLDARPVGIADFPLAGVSHGLSMTILPCAVATITVDAAPIPGRPRVWQTDGRSYSSAVTAVHESWSA